LCAGLILYPQTPAKAATEIILSWSAVSLVPEGFLGKTLPGPGSSLAISAQVIKDGVPLNMSKQKIAWYLNDFKVEEGVGKTVLRVSASKLPEDKITIRAELPDISDAPTNSVVIRTEKPKAGMMLRYKTSQDLSLSAFPFYFNSPSVNNLSYEWKVNGKKPDGALNPKDLLISVAPGVRSISASLFIKNPEDENQYAHSEKYFGFQD